MRPFLHGLTPVVSWVGRWIVNERTIVRAGPRLDVFPVLTVLERKVFVEVTLPGSSTVRRRTKLGVRTVDEWRQVMWRIVQRHRLCDEKHSGLGLPFDSRNPRFIFFPQVLPKNRIPRRILLRYDHDIVRNVRRNSDGSVDMTDMRRKRNAARLKKFGKRAAETWTEVTIRDLIWDDERTRTEILARLRGAVIRRPTPQGAVGKYVMYLKGWYRPGRFEGVVAPALDGVVCDIRRIRTAAPERLGSPID
jgi:hypothetical protein